MQREPEAAVRRGVTAGQTRKLVGESLEAWIEREGAPVLFEQNAYDSQLRSGHYPSGTTNRFKGFIFRALQTNRVTLGKRISARRRALGWSQNELARRADVNHPTLFKIEADQRLNPSISVVVRIARALGTTAEALYGWERDDARFIVEANKTTILVDVRPLGKKSGDAAPARALNFVATALERAGAKVRDAVKTDAGDVAEGPSPPHAAALAAGGLALVEELRAIRRRLDALENRRQGQEGRVRKRASR